MGQKVDARIFRLGICKKTWEQKYIEKKNEDSSLYLYKTLEIRKYLFRIFELYKIKVHNCKILYSDNSIQIFISFYVTEKTIYIIDKNLIKYQKKISTRLLRRTKKSIKKYRSKKKQKYIKRHKSKKKHISKKKQKCKKKRIYISKYISKIKNKKIKKYKKNKKNILRYYSKILCIRKKNKKNLFHFFLDKKQTILLKKFEDVLLGSLSLYTKEKTNIFIKLQNLNKYKQLSSSQIKDCKTIFKQLKKFTRNSFYKEAINTILISVSKRKSAKLLAEYISYQFRLNQIRSDQVAISRKDNYFLGFLKQSIKLLINTKISRLTGAKIVIKGRFNRAPRAKKIIMQFGKFSLQSIKSKIDYYKSTAYTINGTFGIKIWICEN